MLVPCMHEHIGVDLAHLSAVLQDLSIVLGQTVADKWVVVKNGDPEVGNFGDELIALEVHGPTKLICAPVIGNWVFSVSNDDRIKTRITFSSC